MIRHSVFKNITRNSNPYSHNLYAIKIFEVFRDVKPVLGRPRHRWEDNIRMDLRQRVWRGVDWTHLARYRDQWRALVYPVMKLLVP